MWVIKRIQVALLRPELTSDIRVIRPKGDPGGGPLGISQEPNQAFPGDGNDTIITRNPGWRCLFDQIKTYVNIFARHKVMEQSPPEAAGGALL